MPLEETFTPESYQKVIQIFSEELDREGEPGVDPDRSIFLELDTVRKDGSIIPIEVNATFIRGDTGSPTGIIGTTRDITKRETSRDGTQRKRGALQSTAQCSFGRVLSIHDRGLIIECNNGLSEITGYSYQELIGMDGLSLISDDTRATVIHNINTGYEKPYEVKGVRKNGEIYPVRLEARNIPYQGKNVRVVEFRDLTETKRFEKEKENLEGQLLQAQKMEAVGKLANPSFFWFKHKTAKSTVEHCSHPYTDMDHRISVATKRGRQMIIGVRIVGPVSFCLQVKNLRLVSLR